MTAENAEGESEKSSATIALEFKDPPAKPDPPTTTISGSNVEISWVAPSEGDSPITQYIVEIM